MGARMLVVGIGGTPRQDSTSEIALRTALEAAAELGAETRCLSGSAIDLPNYDPRGGVLPLPGQELVEAVRAADALIIASPGYHGTISGMVKNALDYLEELRTDPRPYLQDLPVGCISVAYGWQAAVNTIRAIRDIAHALRGWPTPYGAAINGAARPTFADGACTDEEVRANLRLVGQQVSTFALSASESRVVMNAPSS